MTFYNRLGPTHPIPAVDPVTLYLEDTKHFLEFRYPRSLEILGVEFTHSNWGYLGLSSPSYVDSCLTNPLQHPVCEATFLTRWVTRIAIVRKCGQQVLRSILYYRFLHDTTRSGLPEDAEYVYILFLFLAYLSLVGSMLPLFILKVILLR